MLRSFIVILFAACAIHGVGASEANVPSDTSAVRHALNRLTLGPRPGDIERVQAVGLGAWIDRQLDPARVDDSELAARLGPVGCRGDACVAPTMTQREARREARAAVGDLASARLVRAAYSERQLEELLVDFWFNHLNVFAGKGRVAVFLPAYERDAIRPHVLGRFRDLLGATAQHPAMLFYLDNWLSVDPNATGRSRVQDRRPKGLRLLRAAAAAESRRKLLIAIFQRGAVDGLNMVVPYGEAAYYTLRRSIAIARPGQANGALDLNGVFGLHPATAPLKPFWDNRSLAIVHACGSPAATRSHFDAQDYMETATPGVKSTRDGWLNRYLQASTDPSAPLGARPSASLGTGRNPLRGVAVTRQMPRTLRAATGGAYTPDRGAAYPRSPFGQSLQEIARIAKAGVGLEVAFAESGNWDHHVNEGGANGQMANRLGDLTQGIAALVTDLGERMADTVIMTMSEFGRAAAENGNGGTDHGHGNALFVIGGNVRGGHVYGRWPGLDEQDRFEGRDLAVTTDFRDVFSEVVAGHLGASREAVARVFPGHVANRPLGIIG